MKTLRKKFFIFGFGLLCGIILFSQLATGGNSNAKKQSGKLPKLIDFGAERCRACKRMAPILEELKKNYSDKFQTEFVDVWIRKNLPKARKYKIEMIPTQIFLDANGKELWRHVGFISKEDILKRWAELGYKFESKKNEK
ncbi:MAG: thioredoxin, partial [Bacteroidetes bacterium]